MTTGTTRSTITDITQDSDYYDPYIRIPSDLFGDRHNRHPPSILFPSTNTTGRSAGVYPPPRPLHRPQPWMLQTGRGGKEHTLRFTSFQSPSVKRRHLPGNPDSLYGLEEKLHQFRRFQCPQCHESLFSWKEKDKEKEKEKEKKQQKRHHFSLTYPLLLQRRRPEYSPPLQDLDLKGERPQDDSEHIGGFPSKVNHVHFHPNVITSLPHMLCTSPCAMHPRDLQAPRRDLDLLYSTSCHGGKVGSRKVKDTEGRLSENNVQDGKCYRQGICHYTKHHFSPGSIKDRGEKDKDIQNSVKQRLEKDESKNSVSYKKNDMDASAGEVLDDSSSTRDNTTMVLRAQTQLQYQLKLFRARLPESLPSKDVVLSWLKHGSAPASESHFPELTHRHR